MSELRFGPADVAGVRLAVSPVNETVMSMWAMADPVRYAVHLPWIDRARLALRRPEVADRVGPLVELTRPRSWLPDFLTPAARPDVGMAEQLDQIAATPPDVVVQDLLATTPRGRWARSGGPCSSIPADCCRSSSMRCGSGTTWPSPRTGRGCAHCSTPTWRTGPGSSPRVVRAGSSNSSIRACAGWVTGWSATIRSSATSTFADAGWR